MISVEMNISPYAVTFIWHLGEEKLWKNYGTVAVLQADGDELQAIYSQFKNIPLAFGSRVVVWRGEVAQFIADNIQ